jgi:hypothetical protein
MARLEPNTIGIRHPATTVLQVDVGDEVFAASSIRSEAVGETVEGSDRQMCTLVTAFEKPECLRDYDTPAYRRMADDTAFR